MTKQTSNRVLMTLTAEDEAVCIPSTRWLHRRFTGGFFRNLKLCQATCNWKLVVNTSN